MRGSRPAYILCFVPTYSHDAAGRAAGWSYGDGTTPAVSMALDFLDRPASVTDAAGTRTFAYGSDKRLASETVPNIADAGIAYTYDAYGRRTGMELGGGAESFAQADYTYDATGRIATAGNAADTLTYAYLPGSGLVASAGWGPDADRNAVEYTYDRHRRLTGIAVDGSPVYGYTLDDRNQRTGASLPDGSVWEYGYDAFGQLTGAVRRSNAAVLDSMGYRYDLIGNRVGATENNASTAYSSNIVNQYTAVDDDEPTYDADGNMLTNGDWSYTWNGENRLVRAENTVTGAALEFDYDYMGRRIFKKVYQGNALVKHVLFAYDGYKLIAEFDALDGNAQTAGYLWQPAGQDVPLMRTTGTVVEYVMADGNKNVIQLRNASGTVTDSYAYAPFGACVHTGSSLNPFRFSSEYHDDETGLVYYNYRYYSPELGRWIRRDPVWEDGGVNLYSFLYNCIINHIDNKGLAWQIERNGESKALATSDQPCGQTITSLASAVGLLSEEFDVWASAIEEHLISGDRLIKKAYIPNTVVALWGGNLGALGRWWVDWNKNISIWNSKGYRVINTTSNLINNQLYDEIITGQTEKTLYGIYFWGHGYAPYPSIGLCSADGVHLLFYNDLSNSMQYTLGFAYIFACDSNAGRQYLKALDWVGFSGTLVPWWPWSDEWEVAK